MKKHLFFALLAIAAITSAEARHRRGRACGSCVEQCDEQPRCAEKKCEPRCAKKADCHRSTGPCCTTECYTVYRPHSVERTTCVSEFEACDGAPAVDCCELQASSGALTEHGK